MRRFTVFLVPMVALASAMELAGCDKTETYQWTPLASVTVSPASASPPTHLEGKVQLKYNLSEAQTQPVKIFLSDQAKASGVPTTITVETQSTAQNGTVEQDVTAGDYSIFTSATGVTKIDVSTTKPK